MEHFVPKQIVHQQQPTGNSCSATCLAMLLGVPVDKVMADFHEDYCKGLIKPFQYLISNLRIDNVRRCYSDDQLDKPEGIYLVAVPSLNLTATIHNIVFDVRNDGLVIFDPNDGLVIFDPNKGKPGKKYYTYDESEVKTIENAIMLKDYFLEVEFEYYGN